MGAMENGRNYVNCPDRSVNAWVHTICHKITGTDNFDILFWKMTVGKKTLRVYNAQ